MAISSDLNIVEIMDSALTAFLRTPVPLRSWTMTGMKEQRDLQRGDKMRVPYYPLRTNASEDWVPATGYDFTNGAPTVDTREVTIDKRKYQPIVTTSTELSRFNYSPAEVGRVAGNKLAIDVNADILSVITAANYGTAAFTGLATAFDSDAVIDVRNACKTADWPSEQPWFLVLDTDYHTNLEKDGDIKPAYSYGDSDPIREGMFGRLSGFNVLESNEIPANGENLTGFASTASAILIGNAPIAPGGGRDDIANRTVQYETVTDPESGITLEYRKWFDENLDQVREVLEMNYGYSVGEGAAIKRIVSA